MLSLLNSYCYYYIGLAKKFVRLFDTMLAENLNELFGQLNRLNKPEANKG